MVQILNTSYFIFFPRWQWQILRTLTLLLTSYISIFLHYKLQCLVPLVPWKMQCFCFCPAWPRLPHIASCTFNFSLNADLFHLRTTSHRHVPVWGSAVTLYSSTHTPPMPGSSRPTLKLFIPLLSRTHHLRLNIFIYLQLVHLICSKPCGKFHSGCVMEKAGAPLRCWLIWIKDVPLNDHGTCDGAPYWTWPSSAVYI